MANPWQMPSFWALLALLIAVPIAVYFSLPNNPVRQLLVRAILWIVGAVSLLLGIWGIFLPLLPTTPFVLLTAACWARASPRFHRWLKRHRLFGKMLDDWERHRAVPRKAKYLALATMSLSCAFLFYSRGALTGGISLAICAASALWLWHLPDAPKE